MRADTILLAHGSGGAMMHSLIDDVFIPRFGDGVARRMDDAATLELPPGRIALTTDTYVVSPLFFPGGNIGRLAVAGTVNDLATAGARPLFLSAAFVLEEGLAVSQLESIADTMAATASEAGVRIVTGDTKVVERGHGDGTYITTSGVGVVADGIDLTGSNCRPGDQVLISGTLGDHGIAVVSVREGLSFGTDIQTDAAPLARLVASVLASAPGARCFRDPTRGGLASALNELASASGVAITVDEDAVPVHPQVRGACEILGYDVFQVANEGKMIAVVPPEQAGYALNAMRSSKYGQDAAIIGEVGDGPAGRVYVRTTFGSRRIMDMLVGEQLPRIC